MEGKKTLVLNLFGSPGSGKSTSMANIFAILKWKGIDAEIAPEFAKELVWEKRMETFKDQLYIFGKQSHRIQRLIGKVDVIITDAPILLTCVYNGVDGDRINGLDEICINEFCKYRNMNVLLNRVKPYNPNGRNQTEEQSDELRKSIIAALDKTGEEYYMFDGCVESCEEIAQLIMEELGKNN